MVIFDYLPLLAGIGLFLYGMDLISGSLEKIAGSGMEQTLEKLTNSKIKGVGLGAIITAVIQSSAATTLMVVGFLNAGILKLSQAVPVIMGANIGTTITAQILRLSDIDGSSGVLLYLLKPSSFAPFLIFIGAFAYLTAKKSKTRDIALIMLGLGSLFFGMDVMETTLAPLKDLPMFSELFVKFSNPLIGILVGAVVTAAIQSSSASVGILQALTSTGLIRFSNAVPIIMGQNIGTCFTVYLSSIGANKNAKRAVFFHLFFNVIGTVIFMTAFYGIQIFLVLPFWNNVMSRGDIANFHSLFNIINTIILLPFTEKIIGLSKKLIKSSEVSPIEESLAVLDPNFLSSPAIALDQAEKVVIGMARTAQKNFFTSVELLESYDPAKMKLLAEYEVLLDRSETVLGNYMLKINSETSLSEEQSHLSTRILHTLGDFERIGDYTVNMAQVAEQNSENHIAFSDKAKRELTLVTAAVGEILNLATDVTETPNPEKAALVEPLEQVIDGLIFRLKNKHIDRLQAGRCTIASGISFIELLTNLERISDHCSNIAIYAIKSAEQSPDFDSHELKKSLHASENEVYNRFYTQYSEKYSLDLINKQ